MEALSAKEKQFKVPECSRFSKINPRIHQLELDAAKLEIETLKHKVKFTRSSHQNRTDRCRAGEARQGAHVGARK